MTSRFPSVAYEILFAHVAGVSRASLFASRPQLSDCDQKRWAALSARLDVGEPLAYILGSQPFYDCEIPVDSRVLIPRPETELLVDATIAWVKSSGLAQPRILDLGTGSGCIAIALARALPHAQITASDISVDALACAWETISAFGLEEGISCVHGDLLAPFRDTSFDCIVTNLPYVGTRRHSFIEDHVRRFEPAIAIFSGDDGLAIYARFFQELRALAWRPRVVFGEFGDTQKCDLQVLMDPTWHVTFHKDLAGLDRSFTIHFSYD